MRKLLLLTGSCFALLVPFAAAAQTVGSTPAMDYAIEQKILYPGSDGGLKPDGYVTRLEFTLATVDTLYPNENADHCFQDIASTPDSDFTLLFSDVDRESWFAKRLCIAMRAGLIKGDARGNFRPYAVITTAEASKILAKAYGLLYPPQYVTTQPWYEGPMLALSLRSAIPATASPSQPVTRQDTATMFYALRGQQRYPETRIIGVRQQTPVARAGCPAATPLAQDGTGATETIAAIPSDSAAWPAPCPMRYRVRSPGQSLLIQNRMGRPTYVERPSSRLLRQEWQVPLVRPGLHIDPAVYY